LVEIGLIATNG